MRAGIGRNAVVVRMLSNAFDAREGVESRARRLRCTLTLYIGRRLRDRHSVVRDDVTRRAGVWVVAWRRVASRASGDD